MKQHYFIPMALIAIILTMGLNPIYAAQKSTIKHTQDFNYEQQQVFNQLFEECPGGTVLYKLNGEITIVCLIDPLNNKLVVNDVNIHIDNDDDGNNRGDNDDNNNPDHSCIFNVYQPKCAPDEDGNCPDGFNLNEDGRCFPDHHDEGCPDGYHGVDDDETGQCYSDDEGCPDNMELQDGNCVNKPTDDNPLPPPVVITTTPLEEAAQSDNQESNEQQDNTTVVTEETTTTTTEEETEDTSDALSTEDTVDNTDDDEETTNT